MEIGDRVMRADLEGVIKCGVIADKYKATPDHVGIATDLYSVKWDGFGFPEKGYMECGLKLENE